MISLLFIASYYLYTIEFLKGKIPWIIPSPSIDYGKEDIGENDTVSKLYYLPVFLYNNGVANFNPAHVINCSGLWVADGGAK